MTETLVRSQVLGPVAHLQLDSPANRNALSAKLLTELTLGLQQAQSNPEVRVVRLGHTGATFCSGADLGEQVRRHAEEGGAPGVGALAPLFQAILDCPKPVVCAVGGTARAGGLGLVAACDIAVAAESATFATSEVRVGVAPAVLSVVVLPKVSRAAAARLFLTGEPVSAQAAQAMGLVSEVVPDQDLEAAVQLVIDQLLQAHPHALAATKRILREVPEMARDPAFAAMGELSKMLFASPEAGEGMAAFLERRRPSWAAPSKPE